MQRILHRKPLERKAKSVQMLQDLLHRIRWDPVFGAGEFVLAYYDRVARDERRVPFVSIHFDAARPRTFSVRDADGLVHNIPLHRVRTVYKDGNVIWQRPARTAGR